MQKERKTVEAVVISDLHLGTYGSKAKEVLDYLQSINTPILVLNGDIIDIWQFSKAYFPKSHIKVIRQVIKMIENGTRVYYLAGNHDETLRRFTSLSLGNFSIENKLILNLNGKKTWIFHGDVFDVFMHHSKWLAKLGANGYGILTLINRFTNAMLSMAKLKKVSLSADIKRAVKKGNNTITSRFEHTVAKLGIKKQYNYVICGHIHWPDKKIITTDKGKICYLNSGDWVESMTALEYNDNDWHLINYEPLDKIQTKTIPAEEERDDPLMLANPKELFRAMYKDVINS